MTTDRVLEMLKAYRFELGRCGHLETQIAELTREAKQIEHDLTIAMVSPGAQQITDMPRGTSVGNPTEKYALRLVEGIRDADLDAVKARIAEMQAEFDKRRLTVMYVESWLSGLTERERWVVEAQVVDGAFWKEICSRYRQRFEEDCSKDTLKRCRDRALEKIYEMAK